MKIAVHIKNPRSCGTCSLCCTVMGVAEIHKERNVRCDLLTPSGRCGVYGEHPTSCREFQCLWLMGGFPVELKPNKIQAVPTATDEGQTLVLHVAPGAGKVWERGVLRAFIDRMAADGIVVMVMYGEERLAVGIPPGIEEDAILLINEVSIDGTSSHLVQLTRAAKDK